MSKYVNITYDRRVPQARMQRTINNVVPFPVPPTVYYLISGTYASDGTTGATAFGGETFFVANGIDTTLADAGNGYWEFLVPSGWSGAVTPVSYIADPGNFVFANVTADQPDNNFNLPKPFLTNADPTLDWSFWVLPLPNRWIVYAQNPDDLTYSVYGTTAGTVTNLDTTPNTGTYYHIRGVDVNTDWATLRSDDVQTSPPSPPLIGLSGSVYNGLYGGTGIPANLFVDTVGTINADGGGNWITSVVSPFTGAVYPVDVTGGTYSPVFRSYVGEVSDQFNQDFVFWDETPVYQASAVVWDSVTGTGFAAVGVEFLANGSTVGTFAANPLTGSTPGVDFYRGAEATLIPHYTGGSFSPTSFVQSSVDTSFSQLFTFIGTAAPLDCPVPGALFTIGMPTPNAVSRGVVDTVNDLLWYCDDSFDNVYYVDITHGTYVGSIVLSPATSGQSAIDYEPLSHKVVVMAWSGSIHVIDPDAKTQATVPGIKLTDPGFHMLTHDDAGTVYASDSRQTSTGSIWAIYPAAGTLIKTTKQIVATDSICWASNINRLFINQGGAFAPSFVLFDPATETFASSVLTNPLISFRYENFYIPSLGHVLESYDGGQASAVIDISQGTDAIIVDTIPPRRVSNATIDTCHDRLFVTAGNFDVYEISLDGSYTTLNIFDDNGNGISPNSLNHSRTTNYVYYTDYNDNGTIHTLKATTQSGSVDGMIWLVDQGVTPDFTGGFAAASGGTGWFSGSAVGDANNPFQGYNPEFSASLVNIDAPYPITMWVSFYGSMQDTGTIDQPSQYSLYAETAGVVFATYTNSGTYGNFNGTITLYGTVVTGVSAFDVSLNSFAGGNFTVDPCNTYVSSQLTCEITVPQVTVSNERVLLTRAGAFALDFLITTTSGFFAVRDSLGVTTIYPDGAATLDFAITEVNVWPCYSATNSTPYGSITSLEANGIQGFSGGLDVTALTQLTTLVAVGCGLNDVNITGLTQLTTITLNSNLLGTSEVDAVLVAADNAGAVGGVMDVSSNTGPPGAPGLAAKASLEGKGWSVFV